MAGFSAFHLGIHRFKNRLESRECAICPMKFGRILQALCLMTIVPLKVVEFQLVLDELIVGEL